MEFVLVILLIIVLISILLNAISDQKAQKNNLLSKAKNKPNNIPDWLQERWAIARNELDEGELRTVPK